MICKSLFRVLTLASMVIVLAACGKGIDRTLDYSGTAKELGESYGKAMSEATPDQQNILREYMTESLQRGLSLAANSNPATVEANLAKRNAEEFQRIEKMTVRELLVDTLGRLKNYLNSEISAIEQFQSGGALKIEQMEVKEVKSSPPSAAGSATADVRGVVVIRNDSADYDYDLRGCAIYVGLDGRQLEEQIQGKNGNGRCKSMQTIIKSKGGKEPLEFEYRIVRNEDAIAFNNLVQSGDTKKITWKFVPNSIDSYITSADGRGYTFKADAKGLEDIRNRVKKIASDIAVLQK